ncbi:MAG TPA: GNAT family N-acetyltransferase [Cellulomonas sp.]|uniref:GNAT family N-acetyltransferase n=1 Tax=Cellulomonas sp. TaxID=40001 RepID=UPI002E330168|nr:GNAT family N-acetyltransferase [Cellulomonas sp.]HEX5332370.1 GNAT family N-acetyltransferase [Cellulomonas sp.]
MSDLEVRVAESEAEITAAGALTAEAYHADRLIDDGDEYRDELLDSGRRADEAILVVAVLHVDGVDPVVVGTVTLAPQSSSYAEVAEPGEFEIRMLAVAPEARRQGVAEALVRACLRESVASGARTVVLSTLDAMAVAHRLYERLGFRRVPERDWHHEGVNLRVLRWDAPAAPGAEVETATWRPARGHGIDGWRAGISGGFTRRANSVMTAGSPVDVDGAIIRVERVYADAGHGPVFRVGRESQPPDLASRLEARGYRSVAQTLVMVHEDLAGLAASGTRALAGSAADAFSIVTAETPDDAWLTGWLGVKSASAPVDRELALGILTGSPAAYLTAFEANEPRDPASTAADRAHRATVGVIRAAFVNDWVALACLAVPAAARRRGLASALTAAAAREADRRGARRAFLQVEHANSAAITVYERLGFVPADAYHYMEAAG